MLKEKSYSELIFSPIIQAQDKNSAKLAIESVFSQDYAFLRPYYAPDWSAFNLLKQNHLLDRQWIKDEIEVFLNQMDRGVIIIEGPEGTGKTTFLKQLAYEWCSIHHFIALPPGSKGIQLARYNLGAQIIRELDLVDWITPNRFQEIVHSPNFLNELLTEGSRRIKNSTSGLRIAIILDGLDDLGVVYDPKSLGIPDELPEKVFIIISQSPDLNTFKSQKTPKIIRLGQDSPGHTSDLHAYCQMSLEDTSDVLRNQVDLEPLVPVLLNKSQGNWLLLTQLLQQLKDNKNSEISIDEIKDHYPDDLFSAYLRKFLSIKDNDHAEWYRHILPILGVLTAYLEPISKDQLIQNAGLPMDVRLLSHLLDTLLYPILNIDLQERIQFNHPSLQKFFSGELINKDLSLQEEVFSQELIENSKQYHLRFSQEILSSWGEIADGLPGLRALKQLTPKDEYGLNFLPGHLEGSGSIDDLQKLLLLEWETQKNKKSPSNFLFRDRKKGGENSGKEGISKLTNGWYDVKFSYGKLDSYLDDIQRAWKNSLGVDEHILYALITSSIITMQSIIGKTAAINDQEEQDQLISRLAACLADLGDPSAALATVELISNVRWKNQAYAEVVPHLPSQSIPSILRYCQHVDGIWEKDQIITNCALRLTELSKPVQALEIARQLSSDSLRNKLFAQLVKILIESNQGEMALEAIHAITNEAIKTDLLVEFSKNMDREALQISLSLIRAFHDQNKKATAIAGLAPYLPIALQRDCFQWLDQLNEESRSKALVGLIPDLRETLLKDALSAAREIKDETLRAPVLVELSIRTAATGEPAKALKLIQAILGEDFKASAIQGLAPNLTDEQRFEALGIVQTFKDLNSQNRAYEGLIPFLHDPILTEILEEAYLLKSESSQSTLFKAVAKRYLDLGETTRSIEIVRKCTSQEQRARLLFDLASLWPEEFRSEILTITLALEKPELLTNALAGLLPFLGQTALLDALYAVIQLPAQGWLGANPHAEILIQIGSILAQRGDRDRSLSILRDLTDDDEISKGLTSIFPHLPVESQAAALSIVQRIQDPLKRVSTLIALMPILSISQIENTLEYLDNFQDEKLRLQVLISISPRIPPEKFQSFMERACKFQEKSLRAQAFAALVSKWLLLPVSQSFSFWKRLIHLLSRRSRPDLLLDLRSLAPVISDLGGISAINNILKSVKDVNRWWN